MSTVHTITEANRIEALQRLYNLHREAEGQVRAELSDAVDRIKRLEALATQQAAIIDALLPEGSVPCRCSTVLLAQGHLISCTYVRASASAIERAERHRHLMIGGQR